MEAAQRSSDSRIEELEELLDFQEKEWEENIRRAKEEEKEARKMARECRPPAAHNWNELTAGGERWARKADVDFLVSLFSEREWRAGDVSTALHRSDLLRDVFDSSEVWTMRIEWMNEVLDKVEQQHWNADLTTSIAVAMNLSTRNLDEIRQLTGKQ
eukprot:1816327-Pleurochrysis_carterae.AAC.1